MKRTSKAGVPVEQMATRERTMHKAVVFIVFVVLALTRGISLASVPDTQTWVFVCEDQSVWVVRGDAAAVWVFSHLGTRKLALVPGGCGKKYSDGRFEIRIDGETAWLGDTGEEPKLCRNDRQRAIWEKAKLDGVSFRATGNEPGWTLEIVKQTSLVFVTDYGASRVELPLPEPLVDHEKRITRWDAGELIVEVIGRSCRDTMSGEAFESTVSVTWKGRAFHGCGRALH